MAGNSIQESSIDASGAPLDDIIPVTKADTDLPDGPCRVLLVGPAGAGTVNIKTAAGAFRTGVPLVVGYNPIICVQVRTGGTASDIWAGY
jgi:hypothetical protein